MASISNLARLGSFATCTAERAGCAFLKRFA